MTHGFGLPFGFQVVIAELCESSGRRQVGGRVLFGISRCARGTRGVSVECRIVQVSFVLMRNTARASGWGWALTGRCIDHEQEALFGRRKL